MAIPMSGVLKFLFGSTWQGVAALPFAVAPLLLWDETRDYRWVLWGLAIGLQFWGRAVERQRAHDAEVEQRLKSVRKPWR